MDHASLLPEWCNAIYRNGALLFTDVVHYYLPILVHCYLPVRACTISGAMIKNAAT